MDRPERSMEAGFDMDFLLQDGFTKTNSLLTRADNAFFKFNAENRTTSIYMNDFQKQLSFALDNGHYVSLISDNHDNPRLRKYLEPEEMLFYFAFMLTMPNVPFFYYGDEIGMPYVEKIESVEGGYERTGSRIPMYWDKIKKNCGFSKADKTLIPVKGYKSKRVKDVLQSEKDPESLLSQLKKLIKIHKEHHALDADASFELISNGDDSAPLAYRRKKNDESIIVIFNTGKKTQDVKCEVSEVLYASGATLKDDSVALKTKSFIIAVEK